MLLEEAAEIAGIAKAQTVSDLLDRQVELVQAGAGLVDQPLMDDGARDCAIFSRLQCACSLSQVTPSTAA